MKELSDNKKFIAYIVALVLSAVILLLLSWNLADKFKVVFNEAPEDWIKMPIDLLSKTFLVTVFFGIIWLIAFIFFEYAKKELLI